MQLLTTTEALAQFCTRARQQPQERPYVTMDTEFMRERSYYSRLCLVQMAIPAETEGAEVAEGAEAAVLVDPLSPRLSLAPLYALLRDRRVIKVFHAARQDLEIFFHLGGILPQPVFDTQVAAMVCGFGDQAGYDTLVRRILGQTIDKRSRFTDWSQRPLSPAQMAYALGDVTHLRGVYEALATQIAQKGRTGWVCEEMGVLANPDTYRIKPEEAWQRIKTRSQAPEFLAVVRELARFREIEAQRRDIPRNHVFKDDALLELAATMPRDMAALSRTRSLWREARRQDIAQGILAAIAAGRAQPVPDSRPVRAPKRGQGNPALIDLLRVLLKMRCQQEGVACRLIASSADLEAMAAGAQDVAALSGWRHEIFGRDALRLCGGEIALTMEGKEIRVVPLG